MAFVLCQRYINCSCIGKSGVSFFAVVSGFFVVDVCFVLWWWVLSALSIPRRPSPELRHAAPLASLLFFCWFADLSGGSVVVPQTWKKDFGRR